MNGRGGSSGDLSRPETERSRQGLEEIPVSPERPRGDPPEPSLADGYHLHPDAGSLQHGSGRTVHERSFCHGTGNPTDPSQQGGALDNVFVERPWRTVKYEEVYLRAYKGVPELKRSLKEYFIFYNKVGPHQNLGDKTPEKIDREVLDLKEEVH